MSSTGASGNGLRGLVVDWGGVLTGSLDEAMAAWAQQDAVQFDHFRDVLVSWALRPGDGAPPDGTVPEAGLPAELPAGLPADLPAELDADAPVAGIEQAPDTGPAGSSPAHRLERGELSGAEFERVLADELGRRGSVVAAEGLLTRMLAGLESLDDDMVGLVRRAHRSGIRTALLSNSWGDHYPEELWDGLFDAVVISGRVGMRKPEPEIFRRTCAELGLPPEQCVMVDDLPRNITGAVAVGMVAVHHRTYEETAAELEALFEVSLR